MYAPINQYAVQIDRRVLTSTDWAQVTYYLKVDDRVSKLRAEYQLIFNIDFIRVRRGFFLMKKKNQ